MNGPPTTPRVMLIYLVSKGRIFGIEKKALQYIYQKGALVYTFCKQGACAPMAPLVPAALRDALRGTITCNTGQKFG